MTIYQIFSNLLQSLVDPLTITVIGLVAAFFFLTRRRRFIPMWILGTLILMNALLFFTQLPWMLAKSLEDEVPRAEGQISADAIVVLGGGGPRFNRTRDEFFYYVGSTRFLEAIRLARRLSIKKIIYTGNDIQSFGSFLAETSSIEKFVKEMGFSDIELIPERDSLRTADHPKYLKPIFQKHHVSKFVLITSASHMARSMGEFDREGLSPIPWPVSYTTDYVPSFRKNLERNLEHFRAWQHEVLGRIATLLRRLGLRF